MARTYPPTRGPWVFYSIQVLEILQHRTTALIDISQICPSTFISLFLSPDTGGKDITTAEGVDNL